MALQCHLVRSLLFAILLFILVHTSWLIPETAVLRNTNDVYWLLTCFLLQRETLVNNVLYWPFTRHWGYIKCSPTIDNFFYPLWYSHVIHRLGVHPSLVLWSIRFPMGKSSHRGRGPRKSHQWINDILGIHDLAVSMYENQNYCITSVYNATCPAYRATIDSYTQLYVHILVYPKGKWSKGNVLARFHFSLTWLASQ